MTRSYTGFAFTAAVLALVGCGQTPSPLSTRPVPAPEAAVAPAAQLTAAQTGRLEIRVAGLGGGYRVQATVGEVKYMRVTLSGGPLASPLSQEVSTAALASGRGTVAFASVPHGKVDVAITALDGEGLTLGTAKTTATVVRGETAVVAATLKLEATHVTSANGGVNFDLTLQDGDVVIDPIASASPNAGSPVLKPVPSPLPSVAPAVALVGKTDRTWHSDGTLAVSGTVKNSLATTQSAKVTVTFKAKTLFGTKVVETVTEDLGLLSTKESTTFSVRSTEKVQTLWGDGSAEIDVVATSVL